MRGRVWNIGRMRRPYHVWTDTRLGAANYLLVEHVEGLNSPHQQLVPRELVSKAVQAFHLALLVALVLWGKYHRNLKKPTLMENLGGAEPVIVGHGPLQCRLEAQGG